ncbi:MAG: aldehyde dehydrogenase family protein [Candidatus Sericytochromatia bacterium]
MGVIQITNPLTTQALYEITEPGAEEIASVYARACAAQERIGRLSVQQRAEHLHKLMHIVQMRQEQILDRIVAETGKSRMDGLSSEIFGVLDALEHFAKTAPQALADQNVHTPFVLMGKKSQVWYEPLGVVLVIAPWNYPFYQLLVPAISAFVCGNAVVAKPSELTPLRGLIEELLEAAGFPADALQLVYGGKATGQGLVEARPELVFFTGSVSTGKRIMATAAQNLTPVVLELGGKDPMIVFEDANLERTANGALWGAITNAGQSCTSVERLYVHKSIYPQFVEILAEKMRKLKPVTGVPAEPHADVGTMTAPFQIETVEKHLADAKTKGARILVGGARQGNSRYFPPTLVIDVNHEMHLMKDETFGPVLPVMAFDTETEVLGLANDSPYGLSASVWSADKERATRVARQLVVGNVSINNVMLTEGNPALPFGGVKDSGFGRYKGVWGLETFCRVKSVLIDGQGPKIEANWYPYTPNKYNAFSDLIAALFSPRKSLLDTILCGLKLEGLANKEKL